MPRLRNTTKAATRDSKKRALPKEEARPTKRQRTTPAGLAEPAEPVPTLNSLPSIPDTSRPPLQLFVWGNKDPDVGQLGLGSTSGYGEVWKPKRHTWVEESISSGTFGDQPDSGLVSVAAGGMHTFLLDERGTVWSAGSNDDNALGREVNTIAAQQFAPIKGLLDEKFRAVQLAAGDSFGAALNTEGELRIWGTYRQSDGSQQFSASVPKQELPVHIPIPNKVEKVTSISAGDNHLVALTTLGSVYTWGAGERGQLGRRVLSRHTNDALVPQKVLLGTRSRKAVVIGTGMKATFAVDDKGEVWAWGSNDRGQLGLGFVGDAISAPVRIPDLSPKVLGDNERVVQIAGGEWHTLFLTSAGNIYSCGASDDFQLGIPKDHEVFEDGGFDKVHTIPDPVLVTIPGSEIDPVTAVYAGLRCSMATTTAGGLFTWGCGTSAQLGIGEEIETQELPHMVVRREGGSWAAVKISCGGQHSMGLFRKREQKDG